MRGPNLSDLAEKIFVFLEKAVADGTCSLTRGLTVTCSLGMF